VQAKSLPFTVRFTLSLLIVFLEVPPGGAREQERSRPTFEAASIHLHDPAVSTQSMRMNAGGIAYNRVTLFECIRAAYHVNGFQISGVESGVVVSERYDIVAKAGHPATNAELMTMLQVLLEDRFKLRFHREMMQRPVYALVSNKKSAKLHPLDGEGEASLKLTPNGVIFTHTAIAGFAEFLSGLGSIGRPVLDRTGIEGAFDFTLPLSDSQTNTEGSFDKRAIFAWPSIFSDVQELGLRLESTKGEIQMLVVDHAEKPAEN
jgi:uncharacterized protein (TIGR03435 family)